MDPADVPHDLDEPFALHGEDDEAEAGGGDEVDGEVGDEARSRQAAPSEQERGGTPISDVVVPSRPPVKPAATFRPRTRERRWVPLRHHRERRSRERDDDADRHRQARARRPRRASASRARAPGSRRPRAAPRGGRLIAPRSRHATEMRVASEIRRFAVTTNGSEKPVSRSAGVARSPNRSRTCRPAARQR